MWLQQVRVQVRPQVQIPGVGRVDLVVGNSLIVECDTPERLAEWQRALSAAIAGKKA